MTGEKDVEAAAYSLCVVQGKDPEDEQFVETAIPKPQLASSLPE